MLPQTRRMQNAAGCPGRLSLRASPAPSASGGPFEVGLGCAGLLG